MKIMGMLKKVNRTLLEMQMGMLFIGLAAQAVGAFFVEKQGYFAASLWFGIAFAFAAVIHIQDAGQSAVVWSRRVQAGDKRICIPLCDFCGGSGLDCSDTSTGSYCFFYRIYEFKSNGISSADYS